MSLVSVQQPNLPIRAPKDPLETIAQGLAIARNIYGIKTDMEENDLRDLQKQRTAQQMKIDQETFDINKQKYQTEKDKQSLIDKGIYEPQEWAKTYRALPDDGKQREAFLNRFEYDLIPIRTKVLDPENKKGYSEVYSIRLDDLAKAQQYQLELKKLQSQETRYDNISNLALEKLQSEDMNKERQYQLGLKKLQAQNSKTKMIADKLIKPSAKTFEASGYANRLSNDNKIFDALEKIGFERQSLGTSFKTGILDRLGEFGDLFKDEELKSYQQAKRDFINAVLRRESGAAIAPSEFESADLQYFPVAGDTQKILDQKRNNRLIVQQALQREADIGMQGGIRMGQPVTPNQSNPLIPKQDVDREFLLQYLGE